MVIEMAARPQPLLELPDNTARAASGRSPLKTNHCDVLPIRTGRCGSALPDKSSHTERDGLPEPDRQLLITTRKNAVSTRGT
jgi:hypothetical protein